ncbi:MAG: OmpH family outer membrane protein [Candidatus Omnitrophica bacterium]|nr:OmpH family outer membrane protein [Candidatus Omnitrophota bacterium]
MGRKAVVLFGAILGLGLLVGTAQAADKFAYVDLSRLFSEYNKTKDFDKVLSEKENVYTAEREKKVNEIKSVQDKLSLLSDKEKENKKGDLESKVKVLKEYDRQKQTDLRKDQDEKMKEILKNIQDTVKNYAEKEGYTMVFNDRVLVYQVKSMDITDKILELLNKGYSKK